MKIKFNLTFLFFIILGLSSCSNSDDSKTSDLDENTKSEESVNDDGKGIGPIKDVHITELDPTLALKGQEVFKDNCSACHKLDSRYVGPALKDVTKRRKPEWIMNMILNPTEMTQKDPVAMELLAEFLAPMAQQNISQDDARALLEYFRQNDN